MRRVTANDHEGSNDPVAATIDDRIGRGELVWVASTYGADEKHLASADVLKPTAEVLKIIGWEVVPEAGVELTITQLDAFGTGLGATGVAWAFIELLQGPNYHDGDQRN
jgi:hypothetical protein